MVDSPNPGHRSPEGTYEKVLKSVLEDPSFTLAEFRALMYLVTKPEGWIIRETQLAEAAGLEADMARRALIGLRTKGCIETQATRGEHGSFSEHTSRLLRDRVVKPAKAQAGTSAAENATVDTASVAKTPHWAPSARTVHRRRSAPLWRFTTVW